jgi:transposase
MTANKLLNRLLRLKGFCVVWFAFTHTSLDLGVKPKKTGCRCPRCGRRGKIKNITTQCRVWDDLTICRWKIRFFYAPKEILCPVHGRIQEEIPWADSYSRITYRLEYLVLVYSQRMSQKAAAEFLRLPSSTFSDILHRAITRYRDGRRIRGLTVIGVDEISYCKGHKYASVVYDLERSCVVWVGRGKTKECITTFFETAISLYQRKKIKFAVCDMSRAYMSAIDEFCPNATLVIDRFHIAKALNEAVDEVRKEQWREMLKGDNEKRKVLKGLRWLLFKHSANRSREESRTLNNLKRSNQRIYRAWVLKDEFDLVWNYTYTGAAEKFLRNWVTRALKSRLEPMRKFAFMIKRHLYNILAFITPKITNAVAEGINRVIRLVKNRASGFRTFEAFTDMIYLSVGNVDIPGSIPAKFRVI